MQTIAESPTYSFARWPPGLGLFFCIFGAAWIAGSVWMVGREISFEDRARLLDGQVVGFVQRSDYHAGTVDAPVFRIRVDGARTVEVPSNFASRPREWNVGDRLQVFYDPATPGQVVADTAYDRFGAPCLFAIAGAFFFAVGVFGISRRRSPAIPGND